MERLTDLPNIGKTMEKRLSAVGISNISTFNKLGTKEVFTRLFNKEGDT
jgi:DNA transformation protein